MDFTPWYSGHHVNVTSLWHRKPITARIPQPDAALVGKFKPIQADEARACYTAAVNAVKESCSVYFVYGQTYCVEAAPSHDVIVKLID